VQGEVHVHDLARHQEAPDQPPSPRGAKEVGAKVDAQQTMGCLVCSYNVARVCIVWLYADVCACGSTKFSTLKWYSYLETL
jgi:hypothetical protein